MSHTTLPAATLLGDRLEYWADVRPDAQAISFEDQSYTWAHWRDRIHRVSGMLHDLGIGRGDRVAFLDQNHLACLEVTLGSAALGAAHAVINWRLAADELGYVLRDSAPRVLFVGEDLLPAFAVVREQVPGIERVVVVGGEHDEYEALLAAAEPRGPQPDVDPEDTCLVLYSSGTTGHPKGVELTHRGINAHSESTQTVFEFSPDAVSLVAMPLFHVGGTCYALIGIHQGACSIMLREVDPSLLFAAIRQGATHVFLVPAVIQGVLAAGESAVKAMSPVRVLAYGASPMPLPMLEAALNAWPDTNFCQVYGMTELSGVVTMFAPQAHRDAEHKDRRRSAGRPLPGVEMRIVDPVALRDVQHGTSGEIWFRTVQAMKGYLGNPQATAETTTPDGWVRTGDVGIVDDEGFVYVVDRLKDMIISGGENIYSPEVENVIAEHPAVLDVAVIGIPDDTWGEAVQAVVAVREGHKLDDQGLIAYCRERLAHYKCPRSVDVVEALPRNATGKVLKRDLRSPYWAGRDRAV